MATKPKAVKKTKPIDTTPVSSRLIGNLRSPMEAKAGAMLTAFRTLTDDQPEVKLLVYCTMRNAAAQAMIYRQGRSLRAIKAKAAYLRKINPRLGDLLMEVGPQYGANIVTNAGPGQSLHNYGLALDAVPLRGGKPVWDEDDPLWAMYGAAVKTAKLDWSGNWRRFTEKPHCQQPGAKWQTLITKLKV